MKYKDLLYHRGDFIKLTEHYLSVAHATQDWKLLELVALVILFRHVLVHVVDLLDTIAMVHSNWARLINYETESYKAWNNIQEQHTKNYKASIEYEYNIACQCYMLKNKPKTYYNTKHKPTDK